MLLRGISGGCGSGTTVNQVLPGGHQGYADFNQAPGPKRTVITHCTEEGLGRDQPGTGQCRPAQACKAADNAATPSADQGRAGSLVGSRQSSLVGRVLHSLFRVLPPGGVAAGRWDDI